VSGKKTRNIMSLPHLTSRPRRNRKSHVVRGFHRETWLAPQHFVLPLFIHGGAGGAQPIASMPGCARLDAAGLMEEVAGAVSEGIGSVVLFPAVEEAKKSPTAEECYNPEGLVQRTIRALKARWPELTVMTDVALDPYSTMGHDGLVEVRKIHAHLSEAKILNDETIAVLCKQAVSHARAGADVIAPSDMMDGRVGEIRRALDAAGFEEVSVLSYTAKYASCFYGPFRDALDSTPKLGDKKTYQMDPANAREALREAEADEREGADIMMVKPAMPYLDVLCRLRAATTLPLAAYQVSGEYAMIKAACANGWLDERKTVLESLMAIRRAGADIIFTYFARDAARWLREEEVKERTWVEKSGGGN
jgi:porphobilinogen synthase